MNSIQPIKKDKWELSNIVAQSSCYLMHISILFVLLLVYVFIYHIRENICRGKLSRFDSCSWWNFHRSISVDSYCDKAMIHRKAFMVEWKITKTTKVFLSRCFPMCGIEIVFIILFYLGKQLDAELQKYLDNAQISHYPARAIIAPYPKKHVFMILS